MKRRKSRKTSPEKQFYEEKNKSPERVLEQNSPTSPFRNKSGLGSEAGPSEK